MHFQDTPYFRVLMITAVISAVVSFIAWRRRSAPGGISVALMMLAVTEWSLVAGLEAAAVGQEAKILWSKLEYLGSNSTIVFLLIFAVEYTGRGRWLTRRKMALLWGVPLLNMGMAATNEWHGLVWSDFVPGLKGSNLLIYHHGPWFWFMMVSVYVYMSVSSLLLIRTVFRSSALHRRQAGALLVAMAVPWIGSIVYILELSPIPGLNIIPMSFLLTGLVLVWSIFGFQLLDLVPVARDTLIESMSDGMLVLDLQNRIVDLNPAAQSIIGIPVSKAIGQPVAQILGPWQGLVDRFRDKTEAQAEITLDQDRAQHHYDLRISPLTDRHARLTGRLVVLRDITERKRAEERVERLLKQQIAVNLLALALGETRDTDRIYHTIYKHIWMLMDAHAFISSSYDSDTQLIHASYVIDARVVLDVAAFPPIPLEEVGHGTQSQVIHTGKPFYIPDYRKAMERTQIEYGIREDGTVVEGPPPPEEQDESTNSALYVPMKVEGQTIGVMQVQSERLNAYTQEDIDLLSALANVAAIAIQNAKLLEKTHQQAQQVQQIMDTVPEGVLLLDAGGQVILANPVAEGDLSVLADAGVGDTITHLGDRPLAELLAHPTKGLWHEVTVDGPPHRVFEVIARPMAAEPGASGWVLVLRDVTQEREAQQRIQQQERLAAVGQLAAGIAHDFNNLLTAIIGFAEMLQMRAGMPESAKEDLARIVGQGQRAAHLIRQILDFSRKSITQQRPLELVPFLKEAVKFLERTIPESIHIVLEMASGEYLVNANPTQIQQALTNLAVNAQHAMPKGGELQLRLSRFPLKAGEQAPFPGMRPGEWITLSVSDTGVGISPEILSHIFEPFFTTREVGEGTGLGLAQVYGIIKQHQGYIDVESQVGKGTTFVIYLPPLAVREEVPEEKVPEEIPRGHGQTVLLVEDEPEVLEAGKAILKHLDYRVLTAAHGQQALEVHAEHKDQIALVLSDMVMPEMGGLELYRLLCRRNPAIKMVVMSGYPLGEEGRDPLPQGVLGWVEKPFSVEKLAQVLHQALKEQG